MTEVEKPALLVVDDDPLVIASLGQWLEISGFAVVTAMSVEAALGALEARTFDAVLTDMRMPGRDGLALLHALRQSHPAMPIVMLTGHGDVPLAVEVLKAGAFDFLTKPHDPDRLVATLRNATRQSRLIRRVAALETGADGLAARLIGASPTMQRLQAHIRALLDLKLDVLLLGETGTGKEVVARVLHDFGPRRGKPFVPINCAAVPAEMIESELFGHEAGAFTGAQTTRIGKFEFASGGTLFLDEIESMPVAAQSKLLRVLQERVIERIGSNRSIPVDLRIISATKVDLRVASDAGAFRADLYFRLAGDEVTLPPLRDRGEDILLLFTRFAAVASHAAGRAPGDLPPEAVEALLAYPWPGNVRELRSVAERFGMGLGLRLGTTVVEAAAIPSGALAEMVDAYERRLIIAALKTEKGSIAGALERLGLPRRTLNEKMRRHGIERADYGG
ncbi:MAG: DNA-binding response regulator [Rhizobiales bacterium PAR1]|nr:MAG: DNA-binding response regulator [Rhizobiales bacterium PAR1]